MQWFSGGGRPPLAALLRFEDFAVVGIASGARPATTSANAGIAHHVLPRSTVPDPYESIAPLGGWGRDK
jgi:hypothetical protein